MNDFVLWLAVRKAENFLFALGFITIIIGYSLWRPMGEAMSMSLEESYQIYFVSIPLTLFFWSFAWYLIKKDKWKYFAKFVWLVCIERVIQEIFYPELAQTYEWTEYAYFFIVMFIVWMNYLKFQHNRYKKTRHF